MLSHALQMTKALFLIYFFFLNDPAPTEISPLPLPAALPIPARRPRGVAYSRMAGAWATDCALRPSHQAAPAPMTAATTAAAIATFHRPDRLGRPYRISNRLQAASTSYGAPRRRASESQAACSVAMAARRAGSDPIHPSTAARSSGPAVPSRYRASAPRSMVGEGGVIYPMTPQRRAYLLVSAVKARWRTARRTAGSRGYVVIVGTTSRSAASAAAGSRRRHSMNSA